MGHAPDRPSSPATHAVFEPLTRDMADPSQVTPPVHLMLEERREASRRILLTLPPGERAVVDLLYGFFDGRPRTHEEVAGLLAVSDADVRAAEAAAIHRLRGGARKAFLEQYL